MSNVRELRAYLDVQILDVVEMKIEGVRLLKPVHYEEWFLIVCLFLSAAMKRNEDGRC